MRAGIALLVAVCGLGSGCHPESEAIRAMRKSIAQALQRCRTLEAQSIRFPSDGGSIVFGFKTDSGKELVLTVLHHKTIGRKAPSYQIIRLSDNWNDYGFDLDPGSLLEEDFLRLLKRASIAKRYDPAHSEREPTRERTQWLERRMQNRSGEWESCP